MKTSYAFVIVFTCAASAPAITINTVSVGNPGNAADTRYIDASHPNGVGAVSYSFNIGKTEVTNAQYVAFLNAVAKSDPYELYNTSMGTNFGGIVRSGSPGGYTYAVRPAGLNGTYAYGNKPLLYVTWGSAARFANWLHNGQPTGAEDASTTEDGAYTLNGTTDLYALNLATRNRSARWWIPSEDEWYKAAYYNPSTGNYYDWPTSTNVAPNDTTPANDNGNAANYFVALHNGIFSLTDVGAYTLTVSPYGTFDQGGNADEWNDTPFGGFSHGVRGGSWASTSDHLFAGYWSNIANYGVSSSTGFRVATIPEPTALLLAGYAVAYVTTFRRPIRARRLATPAGYFESSHTTGSRLGI